MNNFVVAPIILPLLTGAVLLFLRKNVIAQRWISLISLIGLVFLSLILLQQVKIQGIQTLYAGGWAPPFGITLVADMLATLLVLTTAIVGFCCVWFSIHS